MPTLKRQKQELVKMKITNEFITELISNLESIGYSTNNIECILQEGSSLYLKNYDDMDFKVIVRHINPQAEIEKRFDIQGQTVECVFYTLREWNEVENFKNMIYFIAESPDMKLIYGSDRNFVRHDIVKDNNLAKKVLINYDKCLFNWNEDYKKQGYWQMEEKRLWNFLLFYFKRENGSHKLTPKQLKILQKAHDLKYSKTMFKDYFNKLKGEIL